MLSNAILMVLFLLIVVM
ncbi:hypothetical protein Goari_022112 [Gossypium aridum]|uniref:Uncharacterized protein n=1 Tax=Gossypium aridum TaxID=34290 RepID=A0A7J8YQV5_GOSAI|nr:hypothetical protein [Gossypium aridum]